MTLALARAARMMRGVPAASVVKRGRFRLVRLRAARLAVRVAIYTDAARGVGSVAKLAEVVRRACVRGVPDLAELSAGVRKRLGIVLPGEV